MNYLLADIKTRLLFVILTLFILMPSNSKAQEAKAKPTRQSSLEAYSKGDYQKAYAEFSELLSSFPKDPLYLYYTGICLVRLEKDPARAVVLLQQARQNSAQLRNVPADVTFWLARAQQSSGNFEDAIASYEDFTGQAGKKTAREMLVPDYIEQCRQGKGALSYLDASSEKPQEKTVTGQKSAVNKPAPVSTAGPVQAPLKTGGKTSDSAAKVADKTDLALSDAMEYQAKADSVNKILTEREKQIDNLAYARKVEERAALAQDKKAADSLQTLALRKFDEAQAKINSTSLVTGKPIAQQVTDTVGKSGTLKPESVKSLQTVEPVEKAIVFSVFEVVNPASISDNKKIEIDPEIPEGLVYRIQIAVFRNPVAQSYFKGITPVYGFRIPAKEVTIYYAGMFRKMADAGKALTTVRQKGFKDAFITPFMEGKTVSSERAGVLEKEWGNKSLVEIVPVITEPRDTLPPALEFRVEVMRSAKPLKDDVLDGMKKVAGARGLDTVTSAEGISIYLIGSFITYESAEEYADLLIRNGYKDARVGAWLGKKEIPVETARQLFEKIE